MLAWWHPKGRARGREVQQISLEERPDSSSPSKCVWLWHTWKRSVRIYRRLFCLSAWCTACHALHALLTQFVCKLELSGDNWSGQIQILPSEQAVGIKLGSKVISLPWTLVQMHSATVCMLYKPLSRSLIYQLYRGCVDRRVPTGDVKGISNQLGRVPSGEQSLWAL